MAFPLRAQDYENSTTTGQPVSGWIMDWLTLSQILDSSKLKELADDNFKFDENCRKFSKKAENAVFLATVFSKDLYCRHVKTRAQAKVKNWLKKSPGNMDL